MDAYVADVRARVAPGRQNRGLGLLRREPRLPPGCYCSGCVSRGDNNLYLVDSRAAARHSSRPTKGPGSLRRLRDRRPDVYSSRTRTVIWRLSRGCAGAGRATGSDRGRRGAGRRRAAAFDLDEAGTTAALVWNVAGRSELAVRRSRKRARSAPARRYPASSRQPGPSRRTAAACDGRAGATAPPDVWVLDSAAGAFAVTQSPHAGVDLAQLVRPELVRLQAHDGLELSGWLYRPRAARARARWCSASTVGPKARSARLQQRLSGPARPGHRGLRSERPRLVGLRQAVRQPRQRALRVDGVKDIKACVDYVVGAGVADPSGSASWAARTAATW